MAWEARIKAALHGEVTGSDVAALLAATNPLATIRQQVSDRRLSAQIEHAGSAWLAACELGPLAAPLWLAESLVGLASSLAEAEAEQHPDRPQDMSPAVHDQCLSLLYPVGPISAELSAMLADRSRPFPFAMPASFGPHGALTVAPIPLPLPVPYARGLLRGAERTQGAAQAALNDLTALATAGSSTPPWLKVALQRVEGEGAAAATRLEMTQARVAALLHGGSSDDDTALRLAGDLWSIIDTYLRAGQQASDPLLLPGAPARQSPPFTPPPPRPATPPPSQAQPAPSPAPQGRTAPPVPPSGAAPRIEPARALPEIGATWQQQATPSRLASSPARHVAEVRPLPRIDPHELPAREATQQGRALPHIGPSEDRGKDVSQDRGEAVSHAAAAPAPTHTSAPSRRRIAREDRWMLGSTEARHRLRALGREDEAERALAAFWDARSWTISPDEQSYLDEVAALLARHAVAVDDRDPGPAPFAPTYRVLARDVAVRGQRIAAGCLFSFDYTHGRLRVQGS